ncbi:MAG: deoxynucleoside kinase [Myxococcota bacterium]|nr:deoxynucleoside kinase [Myxococcota bacterium]
MKPRARFVAVEGLIGVGKTSLCRVLQERWSARLVLEPCDDNPFLASFYADRERFAFPAQMFYLASRYAQQMDLNQGDLFHKMVVSDYVWQKDRLFADETLAGDEMALYDRFAGLLGGHIARPDFVVFLDAPTHVVRERIATRAIESEQVIEADYLDALRTRYYKLWDQYTDAPVYIVDTTELDYVNDASDRERMIEMLEGWLSGTPVPGAPVPYRRHAGPQLRLFAGG